MRTIIAVCFTVTAFSCSQAAQADQGRQLMLAQAVRGCSAHESEQCLRLATELERWFVGPSTGADQSSDHALAHKLSASVTDILASGGDLPVPVTQEISACRNGRADACQSVALVLTGLFTGDDNRLERSSNRALAHALADAVVARARDVVATTR